MTLLDFELHMRAIKVTRGRTMFLREQVTELKVDGDTWEAVMKIGHYYVLVDVEDLSVIGSSCNCDARRTRFCDHAVAVLFAIRKQLGLKPILASTIPQLPCVDHTLANMLSAFKVVDYVITDNDTRKFAAGVKQRLKLMKDSLTIRSYDWVAGYGLPIIIACHEMDELVEYSDLGLEKYVQQALEGLEKLYTAPIAEELKHNLFHDTRIEAIKNYQCITDQGKNWFDVLLAGANNATRQDQFTRTMNALCILVRGSEDKANQEKYVNRFLYYRDKLKTVG